MDIEAIKKGELIAICQDLIRINSENPPGNENGVIDYCDLFLKGIGAKTQTINHSKGRSSLIAKWPGGDGGKEYLFVGHADTVPCGDKSKWWVDPFSAEIIDNNIYGRGASDMKGGIASLLMAMKLLKGKKLRHTIILAFTADEESGGLGARSLINPQLNLFPDLVIIPEPTENHLAVAEKGALWLELTVQGKTAHASMPDLGLNAVKEMAKIINNIDLSIYKENTHKLLGEFTASFTTIRGGEKTNIIPDLCRSQMDIRFLPKQTHTEIMQTIKQQVKTIIGEEASVDVQAEALLERAAIESDSSLPLIKKFFGIVQEIKQDVNVIGVSYFTDAAVLIPHYHAPFVICGPGNPNLAHANNENIAVEKLYRSYRIYDLLLKTLALDIN